MPLRHFGTLAFPGICALLQVQTAQGNKIERIPMRYSGALRCQLK